MGELKKMIIKGGRGYSEFEMKINPESLKFSRKIEYNKDLVLGIPAGTEKFNKYVPTTLSFDFLLDSTGIAYPKTGSITKTLELFEKIVFTYAGGSHRPNNITIIWAEIVFKCHLNTVNYDYLLFAPSGEPLRVKVSVSFSDSISLPEAEKQAKKTSPDMTHLVVLKAGESIAVWCNRIYGDASYCADVARHNRLQGFRNVKPGTKIEFPPLVRN